MNKLTTFETIRYERPDFAELKRFYEALNTRVNAAQSYAEVRACIFKEEEFSSHFNTNSI